MAGIRQTRFSAGELGPLLWGRSDLDIYGAGLRRCRDFFPTRHGALVSRPGTVHIGAAFPPGRLVPFIFSDTTSYLLHFTHQAIVVYRAGVRLAVVPSPYLATLAGETSDVRSIRFVQSGNVLTIACRGHPPRTLTRVSDTVWRLEDIDFSRPASSTLNPRVFSYEAEDPEHPAREWDWLVTTLRRDARGMVYESAPAQVTADGHLAPLPKLAVYPDRPVVIRTHVSTFRKEDHPGFIAFVIYRGRGGLFGVVGQTDTYEFTDTGDLPNYAVAPPQGRRPFVPHETPRTVAYFEERLVFGGTGAGHASADAKAAPNRLLFSATADYYNFDERLIPVASQALMYELASRRREEIRHLLGLHQLLVFTSSSVWAFGGEGGVELTPDARIYARVQEEIGCTEVPPLTLAGAALYVRNKGAGVRALRYEQDRAGFVGQDLSAIADHFFTSEIVDWTYAEDPWGLVWCVRRDGKVLSLTYSPIDGAWGWALHDFGGRVLSICSIPEGDEDAVYLLVERPGLHGSTAYYSLERMSSRVSRGTVDDDVCLDMAHRYQGTVTTTLTGLGAFAGRADVWVVGKDNAPVGPLAVSPSGVLELPEPPIANAGANVVLWVGFRYQPEIETLDAAPSQARAAQKTVTELVFEVDQSRGLHIGSSLWDLSEWSQREVADGYGLPSNATEVVRLPVNGTWDIGGRAALRQALPLPVTIVGLTRVVDLGG